MVFTQMVWHTVGSTGAYNQQGPVDLGAPPKDPQATGNLGVEVDIHGNGSSGGSRNLSTETDIHGGGSSGSGNLGTEADIHGGGSSGSGNLGTEIDIHDGGSNNSSSTPGTTITVTV